MARNPETDYLHVFRFGVAFDRQIPMGFTRVDVCPKKQLTGPGSIVLRSAWTPLIIEFLQQSKRSTLDVSAFRMVQDPTNDPADLTFRLHGVRPCDANMWPIKWDASSDKILMASFEINYESLELIEGEIKLFQPMRRSQPRVRVQPSVVM